MLIGSADNHRLVCMCILAAAVTFLSACEAKLDLSAVEAAKTNPTARYDHYQAAASSGEAVVIIGNRGVILVSNDAGENWSRHSLVGSSSISFPTLVDIDVCPDNKFVALDADRKIWLSDDNGENWISKIIPTEEDVLDLTCDKNGTLWVVGSFTLIMDSHDGGETWTDKSIAEDAMFSRVQFMNENDGIVTGEFGTVYATSDGGKTWEARNPIPNEFYPMASHFISPGEGWVGGLQGIIFHTEDGGKNWQRQETGIVAPIYNICVVNGLAYAVGEQGTILTLQGNTWKPVKANLGFGYLRAMLPMKGGELLIAGGGGLVKKLTPEDLAS